VSVGEKHLRERQPSPALLLVADLALRHETDGPRKPDRKVRGEAARRPDAAQRRGHRCGCTRCSAGLDRVEEAPSRLRQRTGAPAEAEHSAVAVARAACDTGPVDAYVPLQMLSITPQLSGSARNGWSQLLPLAQRQLSGSRPSRCSHRRANSRSGSRPPLRVPAARGREKTCARRPARVSGTPRRTHRDLG
jgi:hypothetical protein